MTIHPELGHYPEVEGPWRLPNAQVRQALARPSIQRLRRSRA